jgi:putative hemolysin
VNIGPAIIALIILVILSAFLSGTETGMYRLSRLSLRLGMEQHRRMYYILDKLIRDSQGVIFSILIGNNLTAYLATSIVTFLFLASTANARDAELYATLIMVPILFIFGELIPKNIFFYCADTLMPRVAAAAWVIHAIFKYTGLVSLMKMLSRTLSKFSGPAPQEFRPGAAAQRHYVRQMIRETREEGVLSAVQVDIIERLINIPTVQLASIMIPLANVTMVPEKSSRADLLRVLERVHYRNLPVYRGSSSDMAGFINIYDLLNSGRDFTDLSEFVKPFAVQPAEASVIESLNRMRLEHHEIMLVSRVERGGAVPLGIVTMKDLVEELIGECALL